MGEEGSVVQIPAPISLGRLAEPFDDPNWIFEIKHDGFRALALIEKGHCWLVSRRKRRFQVNRRLGLVSLDFVVVVATASVSNKNGLQLSAKTECKHSKAEEH